MINSESIFPGTYRALERTLRAVSGDYQALEKRANTFKQQLSIDCEMPEAGGGGGGVESTPAKPEDTGDNDPDPEPERHSKPPSPSGKRHSVTSSADALLWTMPTLTKRLGLSRSNIYQQIQTGNFPEPLKLGRSSRWLATEIHTWIQEHACARSPKSAG